MAVQWNALLNAPNPGQAFMDSFNQARQMRQREAMFAQQQREHQEDRQLKRDTLEAQQHRAALEQHRDKILTGAKIVRQFQPRDQATWDQARAAAAQLGIDVSGIPAVWDQTAQQYAQGLIGIAEAMEKDVQAPSFIREADALGIPRNEAAQLWRQRQGTVVINGVPHIMQAGDGQAPPVLTDEDILRMEGGQSGGGSTAIFQPGVGPR